MPSSNEHPPTILCHGLGKLHHNHPISPLGTGDIVTDVFDMGTRNDQGQKIIQSIKHPLTDRDLICANWTRKRMRKLRAVLMDIDASRRLHWANQPVDDQRFGRRESMTRQHSIKVVEKAIRASKQREKDPEDPDPWGWNQCLVM